MTYLPFYINDRAQCVWGFNLQRTNTEFLRGIDPEYFLHLVAVHEPLLEGVQRHYAATALRAAYTHGLETLFALLAAYIQAPNAVAAWMVRYKNQELESIVKKLCIGARMNTAWTIDRVSWQDVSEGVHANVVGTWSNGEATISDYAKMWDRLADDFTNRKNQAEYNSIKHGLRVAMGGFWVAFGPEREPGIPANAADMRVIGRSDFGSTYFDWKQLSGPNFRLLRQSMNWDPRKYIAALHLISMSINNVLGALKIENGVHPETVLFQRPEHRDLFENPWTYRLSLEALDMSDIITADMITPFTKQEVEQLIEQTVNRKKAE